MANNKDKDIVDNEEILENQNKAEDAEDFDEYPVLKLTDEETGEEIEFLLLASEKIDGQLYYAVQESNDESDEYVVLKVYEDGEDILFESITDDDEFEKVEDVFNDMFFNADVDYDN